MAFRIARPQPRRRVSLTPMIDVVFLLLVFFMVAARFGHENSIALVAAGQDGSGYSGPPRLVEVTAGAPRLNGIETPLEALPGALGGLMAEPGDLVVLRAAPEADVQAVIDVLDALSRAGIGNVAVME